jgi:hypothetical protein
MDYTRRYSEWRNRYWGWHDHQHFTTSPPMSKDDNNGISTRYGSETTQHMSIWHRIGSGRKNVSHISNQSYNIWAFLRKSASVLSQLHVRTGNSIISNRSDLWILNVCRSLHEPSIWRWEAATVKFLTLISSVQILDKEEHRNCNQKLRTYDEADPSFSMAGIGWRWTRKRTLIGWRHVIWSERQEFHLIPIGFLRIFLATWQAVSVSTAYHMES